MQAHHRQAEQAGRVHGPVVIGGKDTPLHLADPRVHELFGDGDVDAVRGQHVGLDAHDLGELGHGDALGMVGDDDVDPLGAVPVQGVGQEHLGGVHVDADHDLLHLGGRVAGQETRVGVGIEQAVGLPGFAFVVLELLRLRPLVVEDAPHGFGAAGSLAMPAATAFR